MKGRVVAAVAVLLSLSWFLLKAYHSSFPSYIHQIEATPFHLVVFYVCVGAFLLFLFQLLLLPKTRSQVEGRAIVAPDVIREGEQALQLGDVQTARSLLNEIDVNAAEYGMRLKLEGDLSVLTGDLKSAEEFYQQSLTRLSGASQSPVLLALGHLYEHTERAERAEDLYREVLQHVPGAMEPLLRLRTLMIGEQDWQQALLFQEHLEERFPELLENPDERRIRTGIRFELARLEFEHESWKTALALVKNVIRLDEQFVPATLLLGDIQEKMENDTAAFRAWERGYKATGHPILLQRIYEAFLLRNMPERAIESLRSSIERAPDDPVPEFCLADLYMKLEMVPEAIRVFERVDHETPDWILNKVRLADAYRKGGQEIKAARVCQNLLDTREPLSLLLWKCTECDAGYSEYRALCISCSSWNTLILNNSKAGRVDFGHGESTRPRLRSTK